MNDFRLPKEIIQKHIDFIRNQRDEMTELIDSIENYPGYWKSSEDCQRLLVGYKQIRIELKSLLRHEFEPEE